MAEPKDMIVPLLKEMRAEMAREFDQVKKRLDGLESGQSKLEPGQKNIRSALAGETVLSRILVGEYEERIEALETKVSALRGKK